MTSIEAVGTPIKHAVRAIPGTAYVGEPSRVVEAVKVTPGSSGTSFTVPFTQAIEAGDVVVIGYDGRREQSAPQSRGPFGVSGLGGTWSVSPASNDIGHEIWWGISTNPTTTGNVTVTAAMNGDPYIVGFIVRGTNGTFDVVSQNSEYIVKETAIGEVYIALAGISGYTPASNVLDLTNYSTRPTEASWTEMAKYKGTRNERQAAYAQPRTRQTFVLDPRSTTSVGSFDMQYVIVGQVQNDVYALAEGPAKYKVAAPVGDVAASASLPVAAAATFATLDFQSVVLSHFDAITAGETDADAALAAWTSSYLMDPIDAGGSSDATIYLPEYVPVDPAMSRPQYTLGLCDYTGTRIGELENAVFGTCGTELNGYGSFEFVMPAADPKIGLVIPTKTEVVVRRGSQIVWTGIVLKARGDDQTVAFQCVNLLWYFTRRVMGKVPKDNLIKNGSFESNFLNWGFAYDPNSIPAAPPIHSIVTADAAFTGTKALQISGADKVQTVENTLSSAAVFVPNSSAFLSGGYAAIMAVANQMTGPAPVVTIEGHTANNGTGDGMDLSLARAEHAKQVILDKWPNAVVTAIGRGYYYPVASNATEAGQAKNRRVVIKFLKTQTAKGHRQFAYQRFSFTNPVASKKVKTITLVGWTMITQFIEPSKDGWGLYIKATKVGSTKPKATGTVSITKETPRNRWTRMEASIEIPADGNEYIIELRLYPPAGTSKWDEISVTASDQLAFFDVDQALIVKGLVEHAQDVSMGKSNLNIGTDTPLTKVRRTREFPWIERLPISEAILEFPTLANGMDVAMVSTGDARFLRTYFPQKGGDRGYVFALGSNIQSFNLDIDGEQTSTSVIVQAEGEGSDREEGYARDTTALNGMVLEKVYNATPGSAIQSLTAQAQRGLKRYSRPVKIPSVTMVGTYTTELLARVEEGDIVRVVIHRGWLDVDAKYRVVSMNLDTTLDQITYTLQPED